jgi:cathepsin L
MVNHGGFSLIFKALLACPATILAVALAPASKESIVAAVGSSLTNQAFDDFIVRYSPGYHQGSSEYENRLEIFSKRHASIIAQNQRPDALWVAGINFFTDRTDEELAMWRGRKGPRAGGRGSGSSAAFIERQAPVESVGTLDQLSGVLKGIYHHADTEDKAAGGKWRKLQTASRIPNQGACGSCWALTAMSVLEAHYEIYADKKNPKNFSAQELVSCVQNSKHCGGKGGCDGATVELAMDYVMAKGLQTAESAPYKAMDKSCEAVRPDCKQSGSGAGGTSSFMDMYSATAFGLTGFKTLPSNEFEPLMQALQNLGPVAVSVSADGWSSYQAGIFNSCEKDVIVDHAVTMYGWGEEEKKLSLFQGGRTKVVQYWSIRNSWGQHWGEKGFIRLERKGKEEGKYCGMDNDAQKGIACDGDPSSVRVCGTCGVLYDSVVPCFEGSGPPCKAAAAAAPAANPAANPAAAPAANPAAAPATGASGAGAGAAAGTNALFDPEWLTATAPEQPLTRLSKMIRREPQMPLS